ncbi:MAG: HAMP domain-containing sensor histidine kinase [Pseudomonadota bacterium]
MASLSETVGRMSALSVRAIEISGKAETAVKVLIGNAERLVRRTKALVPVVAERTIETAEEIRKSIRPSGGAVQADFETAIGAFTRDTLDNLQRTAELQFRAEAIFDAVEQVGDTSDPDRLTEIRDRLLLDLRALTNEIVRARFADDGRVVAEPVKAIYGQILGESGVFELRRAVLDDRQSMEELRTSAEASSRLISGIVEQFVSEIEQLMDAESARTSIRTNWAQAILIVFAALAIAASALVYFSYVDRSIVRRVNGLATAVNQLTEGSLAKPVPISGNDQITRLEEAAEALRTRTLRLREAEEALQTHAKELERSNKDLQQFAYVTSHDLRAPLRGIRSLSEWIQEDIQEGNPDDVAANMERLRGRVGRMESLLGGILRYSRASSGAAEAVDINFEDLARQIFNDLNSENRFRINLKDRSETFVADYTFVHQLLSNLIGNAIKHHNGSEGRLDLSLDSDGDFYCIVVDDDGPGIPEDMREKVLQMFQTLKPRDEVEASGIGLAIVKRLVERRNGKLIVGHSELGGARFEVKWPREGSA